MKTAIIILGHGSRSGGSDKAIKRVAAEVKINGGFDIVEHAFLQYGQPDPDRAVQECIRQGAEKIAIVPFFMQSGAHVNRDVPKLIEKIKEQYPDIELNITDFVGSHPLIKEIVTDLVKKMK